MGFPIKIKAVEVKAAILELTVSERAMLIAWIADSILEDNGDNKLGDPVDDDHHASIPETSKTVGTEVLTISDDALKASTLHENEKVAIAEKLFGAWKHDTADDLTDQVLNARTVSTREINFDA